jgi:hypothetical protein
MNRNGFRVSPAEHPWQSMADLRAIERSASGAQRGDVGNSQPRYSGFQAKAWIAKADNR